MGGLRRDPILLTAVATVAALVAISFVLPVPPEVVEEIVWWADFFLLGLTILAVWRTSRHEAAIWGRRFWKLLTIGLCLWFVVLLEWQYSPDAPLLEGEVVADFLFLGYYFALLLATATKPHDRSEPTQLSPVLLTEVAAGALLVFGMLAYFVLLPSRLTPESYETYVPSLSLYVVLDAVLVSRLVWWCRKARGSRWQATYCTLVAAFGCTLLHDIHELLVYTEGKSLETSLWDLIWWGQFVGLILASRVGLRSAERGADEAHAAVVMGVGGGRQAILGPVASYAFILPVIHLGGRLSNLLDRALDRPRETLVLGCAVLLGGLAVLHQELLNRRYRVISQNLHDAQILLQQSRKMEALGRLAGGVAHGFNNLLSVIVGYTEILMERVAPGDEARESLEQIRFASERAATLTRQLATFSRGRLGEENPLDLDHSIGAFLPTMRRVLTDRVALAFAPGAPGVWIQADADQFERALLNVVANARDATPDGGSVRISTRAFVLAEGESPTLGLLPPGPYAEIAIVDSGAGMDEEVRSRLFEPFFTTRQAEGHRGLGLAIVYGVVRQASGHIEVDSALGAGTTVRLYLPRRQPAVEARQEKPAPSANGRPFTVLLAEDERGLRRLIRSTLELEGFTVLEAADGRAAVDTAEDYAGAIDLLLSDVVMPGLGGPDAARKVVAARPETRVLFISGYAPETLGDLRMPGTEATLLPKPFSMSELVAKVHALLPVPEGRPGGPGDEGGMGHGNKVTA